MKTTIKSRRDLIVIRSHMPAKYLIINPDADNVATALAELPKNSTLDVEVRGETRTLTFKKKIPFGHKFVLEHLEGGDEVVKYGQVIGVVKGRKVLEPGDYAHTRQIKSQYHRTEFKGDRGETA